MGKMKKQSLKNLSREIKGMEMARKRVPDCKCLLLTEQIDQTVDLPDWCKVMQIPAWLLGY